VVLAHDHDLVSSDDARLGLDGSAGLNQEPHTMLGFINQVFQ
jgi:hypothetical protein